MSNTPLVNKLLGVDVAEWGGKPTYGRFDCTDPWPQYKALVDHARSLERLVHQQHEALQKLTGDVDRFCSEEGEWDFFTGDALKALAAYRAFVEKCKEGKP